MPTVEPISFELLNQRGGQSLSLAVADGVAYLGVGPRLVTVDITEAAAPRLLGQSEMLLGVVQAVLVHDGVAYVGTGAELMLFDITDPADPALLSFYLVPAEILLLQGSTLAVAGGTTLTTWNISEPGKPTSLAELELPIQVNSLAQAGDLLLAGSRASGEIYAVDIGSPSEPGAPFVLLNRAGATVSSLAVTGDMLYVGGTFSLERWDLSDPVTPVRNWQPANVFGVIDAILPQGEWAYLSSGYGDAGVYMTNFTAIQLPGPAVDSPAQVSSQLAASGELLLVADAGLTVYRQGGEGGPETVGRYFHFPPVTEVALTGTAGVFVDGGARSAGEQSGLYVVRLPDLEMLGQYTDDPLCQECRTSLLNVVVSDTLAYVGAWEDGLRILDLADPTVPRVLGSVGGFWITEELTLENGSGVAPAFLGGGTPELALFDLRRPADMSPPAPLGSGRETTAAAFVGGQILAATAGDSGNRLQLVSLSHGEEGPVVNPVASAAIGARVNAIESRGNLTVAATEAGIAIFSIAERAVVAEMTLPGGVHAVALTDDLALATSANREGRGTLFAIDLSDPLAPQRAGEVPLPAGRAAIAAANDTLLLGNEQMGLILLQISR